MFIRDQVVVVDAEFGIAELQAANVSQYVVRMATNCTARRNQLPDYKGKGRRPQFGAKVRPSRANGKTCQLAATAPDQRACSTKMGGKSR